MLDKGFFIAIRKCLYMYGSHRFRTARNPPVEGGSSKVDYAILVDDQQQLLIEAESPSVMKKFGELLLPLQGFELTWRPNTSLVQRILSKVSMLCIFLSYSVVFNGVCVVCTVSGSEKPGMVIPFMPQLLGGMSACE